MSNPLSDMLGGRSNSMAAMRQAMQAVSQIRTSGNPQQLLLQMAKSNPNIQKAMELCKGKNPQEVFTSGCKQAGFDPSQFTNMVR